MRVSGLPHDDLLHRPAEDVPFAHRHGVHHPLVRQRVCAARHADTAASFAAASFLAFLALLALLAAAGRRRRARLRATSVSSRFRLQIPHLIEVGIRARVGIRV